MGWAEAKWIVDSLTPKLSQSPNNMRVFSANSLSGTEVGLTFLEPSDSYESDDNICAVKGVVIRMSTEHYPSTPDEGTLVIDNTELGKYETNGFTVSGLRRGSTYYFSAFPYSSKGAYNLSKDSANRAVVTME